jgi:hypothetical protein
MNERQITKEQKERIIQMVRDDIKVDANLKRDSNNLLRLVITITYLDQVMDVYP